MWEEPTKSPPMEVPSWGRKRLVVGVVIAVIVVASAAAFFTIPNPGAGGGPAGAPVYVGALENEEATTQRQQQLSTTEFEVKDYTSTDNISTVAAWYQSEMASGGWTKENENVIPYYEQVVYYRLYKKANDGLIICIDPNTSRGGGSKLEILAGGFENLKPFFAALTVPAIAFAISTDPVQDNIIINVYGGSIPAGQWEYRLSQTVGSGTWTTGTIALQAPYVSLENKADTPGTWYVSLRNKATGHVYSFDSVVTVV